MRRLLISGFVAVALLAVATTLRSYSISSEWLCHDHGHGVVEKISGHCRVNKLPTEEFEDMSFVFPAAPKP